MIVAFGSINLDLVFPLPRLPTVGETVLGPCMSVEPGGKGANQAVAAARDGASVIFAGAVGADALAQDALRMMRAHSIDTSRIVTAEVATGCAAICVDPLGRNLIAVASGANLSARQTQVEDALLGPGTTLLLQMEVLRADVEALIHRAHAAGCRIVLNLAPASPLSEASLQLLDVLVLNEGEAAVLASFLGCEAHASALHRQLKGVNVVVTLGGHGLEAAFASTEIRIPALAVNAVDTAGAGDCFTGVLASSLDRGLPMHAALVRANTAAALCCTRQGTQGSMPDARETNAALS